MHHIWRCTSKTRKFAEVRGVDVDVRSTILYETRVDYSNLHGVDIIKMSSVNVSSSIVTFDY